MRGSSQPTGQPCAAAWALLGTRPCPQEGEFFNKGFLPRACWALGRFSLGGGCTWPPEPSPGSQSFVLSCPSGWIFSAAGFLLLSYEDTSTLGAKWPVGDKAFLVQEKEQPWYPKHSRRGRCCGTAASLPQTQPGDWQRGSDPLCGDATSQRRVRASHKKSSLCLKIEAFQTSALRNESQLQWVYQDLGV